MSCRFEKPVPPQIDVVNPLLQINNPEVAWLCGHPLRAENKRQTEFEASTNQVPSQFELVEMDTAEIVDPAIQQVIQRANPAPGQGRQRGRPRRNAANENIAKRNAKVKNAAEGNAAKRNAAEENVVEETAERNAAERNVAEVNDKERNAAETGEENTEEKNEVMNLEYCIIRKSII